MNDVGPKLIDRALSAARRGLGRTGLAPPNGAALYVPDRAGVRTAALTGPGGDWPAVRLLPKAGPGAVLGLVVEPTSDRVDVLRKAGVTEVWLAGLHPDPPRRRRFVKKAERAGLKVVVTDDPRVTELHEVYNHATARKRAYVVLKMATSIDGRNATRAGHSQWITGPRARAAGRRLRAELDAILVGIDTVLADDPQLTARRKGVRDPVRVILDSRLRLPVGANVVQTARHVPTIVLTTRRASASAKAVLGALGVEVATVRSDKQGRVNVAAAAEWLLAEGLPGLLVEGGGTVHGAFVDAGIVDRVVWFGAPMLLGGQGLSAVGGRGPAKLAEALRFTRWTVRRIDTDWRIDLRR